LVFPAFLICAGKMGARVSGVGRRDAAQLFPNG
jgi:hypothetical protein